MITVFYDGNCGLCAKEIAHYKRIAHNGAFNWVDITQNIKPLNDLNITLEQAMKKLHTQDANGKIYIGIDSFILIWKHLPYFKPLGYIVSLPIIKHIASFAYYKFANWRFKRITQMGQ